jgi:hypothetical protein
MNQNSNPLDYLIELCESAINTGKWNLTKFTILNAKDELRRLREKDTEPYNNIAWATINSRGDFYNLTLHYNRFQNEDTLIPLYCNKKEFQEKYGKLSKQTL